MTVPASVLWSRVAAAEEATVHALVIGVSRYDHFPGGAGPETDLALLRGLGQLSAAATAAARVANWLRDHFDYPEVTLGSVRLLASPSPGELPLPGGVNPPPATYDEVKRALFAWRKDARATSGNITLLYVAGHGIQTSKEGGILLLQDAGDPNYPALDRALDVASIRRGMVADPTAQEAFTPRVQYYFYDACRVLPAGVASYDELRAGITFDEPRGPAADTSWVLWGSRPRDYALADAETRTTLFSKALIDTLVSRAQADQDGRTVRCGYFTMALEAAVEELATDYGEQQTVDNTGTGQTRTPVYLRPRPSTREEPVRESPFPEAARPVTVTTPANEPRGMTIRSDQLMVEGVTDRPVGLPPGTYTVAVDQPWGGQARATITVPWGSAGPVEVPVDAASQAAQSTADAPRLTRQLGPSGGGRSTWFMRFLTWTPEGLRHQPEALAPAVKVDDLTDDTVAIILHARGGQTQYVQLRTGDGRSLVVGLPINDYEYPTFQCWLHVRVSDSALGAVVRLPNPATDACAGYLTGGRPDHVLTLGPSFEAMLKVKMRDPIGAALAAYALLRLNEIDRIHDWADNLAKWFVWLPDGPVLAGEVAARRGGQDHRAAGFFAMSVDRGLPIFSEGLSLFVNRLPQLLANADLAQDTRTRLQRAAPLLGLGPMAEFGALTTTLHIDPDQGPVTADAGWRQFVPVRQARYLRDFWRAP